MRVLRLICDEGTERGETYNEVADLSDKLLSLDRLKKDEFPTKTSHEPLNGIINIINAVIEKARGSRMTCSSETFRSMWWQPAASTTLSTTYSIFSACETAIIWLD